MTQTDDRSARPRPGEWTVGELLKWAEADFREKGIDSPRLDAEILLAHSLSMKRVELYTRYEELPGEEGLARFRQAVKRRRNREPAAYILGFKEFHDITLSVPAGRFIPRPETELLVDEVLAVLKKAELKGRVILDIGTGTGAIPLAILHALPLVEAVAVDLDPTAGEAVTKNAAALGLADRIRFLAGDGLEAAADLAPFDHITCNPPYVPSATIAELQPEVRDHEPRLALDGGEEGLDFIRRLAEETPPMLRPGGRLFLEIGEGQEKAMGALAGKGLVLEKIRNDLQGIPRIVIFRRA